MATSFEMTETNQGNSITMFEKVG